MNQTDDAQQNENEALCLCIQIIYLFLFCIGTVTDGEFNSLRT